MSNAERKLQLIKKRHQRVEKERENITVLSKEIKNLVGATQKLQDTLKEFKVADITNNNVDLTPVIEALVESNESYIQQSKLIAKSLDRLHTVVESKEYSPKIDVKTPETKVVNKQSDNPDIFALYDPTDTDEESETTQYYGFTNKQGNWFILRQSGKDSKQIRFASGIKNFEDNWGKRKTLDYTLRSEANIRV